MSQNWPESVPEFCSICPRKMSFVPEKIPKNPRMAPEKCGMYGSWMFDFMVRPNKKVCVFPVTCPKQLG